MRGTTRIEAVCLSLLGSTQPGRIAEYVHTAVNGGAGDDGLIQRFGLMVWPDQSPEWREVDRWPDTEARETAWGVFQRLDKLTANDVRAETDRFGGLPFLRFDDAAQEAASEWRADLEAALRAGDMAPALESHLAKYRKLVPTLALIDHLADGGVGPVGEVAFLRAKSFGEHLETHARRVYGSKAAVEVAAAKIIVSRIRKGDIRDGFTARDIHQKGWSGLTDIKTVKAALDLLEDYDWVRSRPTPAGFLGGRPSAVYSINPGVSQ